MRCNTNRNRAPSRVWTVCVVGALSLCLSQVAAQSDATAIIQYPARSHPVVDTGGMVATQSRLASAVGAKILARGGNAVDAAVAVGFALAVTLPRAGNLGGGGFMLVHLADENRTVAIDYREMAPQLATWDMFVGKDGEADKNQSRYIRLSAGVPGTVAGLHHALTRYGTLSWKDVIEPAVELAANGIVVSADLASSLERARERMARHPASMAIFFKEDGSGFQAGEVLVQRDLATSLKAIAKRGPAEFYEGRIAHQIVADMREHGGLISAADLAGYEVIEREPVRGEYRGYEVVAMPPPSSGGVHIVQMLNVLEQFPLAEYGYGSAAALHLMAETMRVAYADRSKHLGDPDFYDVPVDWLTGKAYAREIAAGIDADVARSSEKLHPGVAPATESTETTHYSVVDAAGNAVANTYTLNFSYGAGITIAGTGILLNNEMDDFSAKAGTPNAFGLLGGDANAVAARKRPLSSMTPTIVFKNGDPYLVTGSPGGSMIINTVLQQIVNVIDFKMNVSDAAAAPRIHHQWFPDMLFYEGGFSADTIALLEKRGHKLAPSRFGMGSLQSILIGDGLRQGVTDPRRPGSAAIGTASIACEDQKAACGF